MEFLSINRIVSKDWINRPKKKKEKEKTKKQKRKKKLEKGRVEKKEKVRMTKERSVEQKEDLLSVMSSACCPDSWRIRDRTVRRLRAFCGIFLFPCPGSDFT